MSLYRELPAGAQTAYAELYELVQVAETRSSRHLGRLRMCCVEEAGGQACRVVGRFGDLGEIPELGLVDDGRAEDARVPPDHEQRVVEVVTHLAHDLRESLHASRVITHPDTPFERFDVSRCALSSTGCLRPGSKS